MRGRSSVVVLALLLTCGVAANSWAQIHVEPQRQETKLGFSLDAHGHSRIVAVRTNACPEDARPSVNYKVGQVIEGSVDATQCHELGDLIPSNAVLRAVWTANVREPDFRGFHDGSIAIKVGTNTIVRGSITGSNGVGTHPGEGCANCNHFEGTLRGLIVAPGPLKGARIRATYAGHFLQVDCPAASIPQGPVALSIDGVAVLTNCLPAVTNP